MTKIETGSTELSEQELEGVTGGGVVFIPILGSKAPGNVPDREPQGLVVTGGVE